MHRLFLAFMLIALPMLAQASVSRSQLPDAELRGTATFRFLGFPVYQARLFTQSDAPLNWAEDFGLELTYLRNLTQYDLIESTMREFKRTGTGATAARPTETLLQGRAQGRPLYRCVARAGQDRLLAE